MTRSRDSEPGQGPLEGRDPLSSEEHGRLAGDRREAVFGVRGREHGHLALRISYDERRDFLTASHSRGSCRRAVR